MTSEEELPRILTAILYADVAGYSRLTGEDKENDIEAAVNLLARAVEIDPELAFDPEQEALRLAQPSAQ